MREDSERDEVKHIDQYGGGTEQAEKLKREEDGTWKMVEKHWCYFSISEKISV